MGLELTDNYVIESGETLTYSAVYGPALWLLSGAPSFTVTNYGHVYVTSDNIDQAVGVDDLTGPSGSTGYFVNATGAVLSASNSYADAYGYEVSLNLAGMRNDGEIDVVAGTAFGNAFGVTADNSDLSGYDFTNTGIINVTGGQAIGVATGGPLYNPGPLGTFNNSGTISVHSYISTGSFTSIGASIQNLSAPAVNSGTIIAENVGDGGKDIGVVLSSSPAQLTEFDNSGTVTSDTAIAAAAANAFDLKIVNTGTLNGGVDLSSSTGVDTIINSGVINGDVYLNQQNAVGGVFNGAGGFVSGTVYGTKGNDTLIGGPGNDTLTGGSGNDTFVFSALSDTAVSAPDTITDFTSGKDKIDLSAIDPNFHLGVSPGPDTIIVSYDAVHGRTVVDLYVSGGPNPDAEIWLTGNHTLSAGDFIF
jgi:Ca2+-binding RTX toxin-like protein